MFPFFLIVLFGVIEFSFALNAYLSIDFGSREAALAAAEAGNDINADCSVLRSVERSIGAPASNKQVQQVQIYKAQSNGDPIGGASPTIYTRTGSMSCPFEDGSPDTLPYTRTANGYPPVEPLQHPGGLLGQHDRVGRHDRCPDHLPVHRQDTPVFADERERQRVDDDQGERDAHGTGPVIRIHRTPDRERTRAQSLVEYAVIVPVFFLILLGMLELGFAFSHHLTMEYATREGARTGAALAKGSDDFPCANVDQQIIAAVQRVLTASGSQVNLNQIQSIRIFKAGANGQELGPVNVWVRGSTAAALPSTPAVGFQKSSPQSWSACSRNNAANPDSIGVSFRYTYDYITPLGALMGATGNPTIQMSDKTVMALNPTNQ